MIQHLNFLNDSTLEFIRDHGRNLVPTIICPKDKDCLERMISFYRATAYSYSFLHCLWLNGSTRLLRAPILPEVPISLDENSPPRIFICFDKESEEVLKSLDLEDKYHIVSFLDVSVFKDAIPKHDRTVSLLMKLLEGKPEYLDNCFSNIYDTTNGVSFSLRNTWTLIH